MQFEPMNFKLPLISALLFSCLLVSACDETFEPIAGNVSGMYSIFGYLDAEADTQWVRVTPIRETIDASIGSINATVTITEIGGATEVMHPGKAIFRGNYADTLVVWNYWSTMDIKPEHEYEITIENPDGSTTSTSLDIPEDFEPPTMDAHYISFSRIDTLAELKIVWEVHDSFSNKTYKKSISHVNQVIDRGNFGYRATVDPNEDFLLIAAYLGYSDPADAYSASLRGILKVINTEVILTAGGSDWIDFYELDREEISVLSVQSNINNGVGYMVGAVRKVVPYTTCVGEGGEIIACYPID